MLFTGIHRMTFLVFSFLIVLMLLFFMFFVLSVKKIYKRCVITIISIGISAVIFYSLYHISIFMAPDHIFIGLLFKTLTLVSITWLTMMMFMYSMEYTGLFKKNKKKVVMGLSIWYCLDSISFFANLFTHHMFTLSCLSSPEGVLYWNSSYTFFYGIHLAICYAMVMMSLAFFIRGVVKVSYFYKRKYVVMIVVYVFVIAVKTLCFAIDCPFDFSIGLYSLIAGLFSFSTSYSFPHKLLIKSLTDVSETVSEAIIYFDIYGNCIYANKSAEKLFPLKEKVSEHNMAFRPFVNEMEVSRRIDALAAEKYRRTWAEKLGIDDEAFEIDIDTFVIDGKECHYAVDFHKEYYNSSVIGMCLKFIDKTEEVNAYRKEYYDARHDELTGIYNRSGFFEAVDSLVQKTGTENYMMFCSDIKDFKFVNEIFGEKLGDQILCSQAKILEDYAVPGSIYGRIADDKFALFLPKESFSEKILLDSIGQIQKLTEGLVYKMHISVGIYEPKGRTENAQLMFDKACMAINTIAENYNEVFAYYDSTLMEKVLDEKNIIHDFSVALDKHQVRMYLQPIFNADSVCVGAEALCRWKHPVRGMLEPEDFLDIIERSGQVYQLDEYIWNLAAKTISEWNHRGIYDLYISVNVSVRDFFFIDIYKTFTRLIDCYDISPSSLHIEITEDFIMADFSKTVQFVNKLQKAGFTVALDNFGNRYSSLNMLKDFSVDILKVDRALLSKSVHEKRNRIILKSIINMANLLNIKTVCEGVESQEMMDSLKNDECQFFQGYLLGKPVESSEFERLYLHFD